LKRLLFKFEYGGFISKGFNTRYLKDSIIDI
jgi:hypothetical protein